MWRTKYLLCRAALLKCRATWGRGESLPSRGAAGFLEPHWRPWVSADRSMLPGGSGQPWGKPTAVSAVKGREWRNDLMYLESDLVETSQSQIFLFWFLSVLVVLFSIQVANSYRLGCVTRPGDGNYFYFCDTGPYSSLVIIIPPDELQTYLLGSLGSYSSLK